MRHARFASAAGSRSRASAIHIPRSRPNDLAAELNRLTAIGAEQRHGRGTDQGFRRDRGTARSACIRAARGANPFLHDTEMLDLLYAVNALE
jgi:hypothetical protein